MFVFGSGSEEKLKGVHPNLVKVLREAIKESPLDFRITQGVRTAAYQNSLYQQGRTKPGKVVTNCDGYKNKSNHQAQKDGFGHAIDIFICGYMKDGKYVKTDEKEGYSFANLKAVADHIKKISAKFGYNVKWGGDWDKFKDYPHFELF